MVYEDLKVTPSVWVFLSFYTTIPVKDKWVSFGDLSGKTLFACHFNHYKNLKDKFACVRGRWDSLWLLGVGGAPSSRYPRRLIRWRSRDMKRSILPWGGGNFSPPRRFEVMETCVVIKLWLEGGNHISAYLSRFLNTLFTLVGVFRYHLWHMCIVLNIRW